jgi:predicted nucleotidyltransferase
VVTFQSLRQSTPAIKLLAAKYGASNLRVFGSVARGTNRPDSDVDFLVEFEPGRTLFDLIGLRLDLTELLGANADVTTPDSLRYIRETVLSEARVL